MPAPTSRRCKIEAPRTAEDYAGVCHELHGNGEPLELLTRQAKHAGDADNGAADLVELDDAQRLLHKLVALHKDAVLGCFICYMVSFLLIFTANSQQKTRSMLLLFARDWRKLQQTEASKDGLMRRQS